MKKANHLQVTVKTTLPAIAKQSLRAIASARFSSLSYIAREALREYLSRHAKANGGAR